MHFLFAILIIYMIGAILVHEYGCMIKINPQNCAGAKLAGNQPVRP